MNARGQAPLALVYGEPVREMPGALYIPPEAMRVMLDNFSGPMDLLLYLVRRHKFDILDIPMAALCRQYGDYVEESLQRDNNLEIAADYLAMAALLVDIKSKMMLPRPEIGADEEEDPRADLVRRLLEYERLRDAARQLAEMPRRDRDFISPDLGIPMPAAEKMKPVLHPPQLAAAFAAALSRMRQLAPLEVFARTVSLREVMSNVLRMFSDARRLVFRRLVVRELFGVSFLAVLQLAAENIVSLHQKEPDEDLFVELRGAKNESDGN